MTEINVPKHVGIILDGNGRWAKARGKERSYGHKKGSAIVQDIVEYAFRRGVESLTLYAFSSENWKRPKKEVDELMKLLSHYLKTLSASAVKNKIRISILGDRSRLSDSLNKTIDVETGKTKQFEKYRMNLCVNYGGRQEIVKAVNDLIKKGEEITEKSIEDNLYTAGQPPLDLIIRTGGEKRLSNFLMYQSAYAELYFTDVLWPDFTVEEFEKAIVEFSSRKRRYGDIG